MIVTFGTFGMVFLLALLYKTTQEHIIPQNSGKILAAKAVMFVCIVGLLLSFVAYFIVT